MIAAGHREVFDTTYGRLSVLNTQTPASKRPFLKNDDLEEMFEAPGSMKRRT